MVAQEGCSNVVQGSNLQSCAGNCWPFARDRMRGSVMVVTVNVGDCRGINETAELVRE